MTTPYRQWKPGRISAVLSPYCCPNPESTTQTYPDPIRYAHPARRWMFAKGTSTYFHRSYGGFDTHVQLKNAPDPSRYAHLERRWKGQQGQNSPMGAHNTKGPPTDAHQRRPIWRPSRISGVDFAANTASFSRFRTPSWGVRAQKLEGSTTLKHVPRHHRGLGGSVTSFPQVYSKVSGRIFEFPTSDACAPSTRSPPGWPGQIIPIVTRNPSFSQERPLYTNIHPKKAPRSKQIRPSQASMEG